MVGANQSVLSRECARLMRHIARKFRAVFYVDCQDVVAVTAVQKLDTMERRNLSPFWPTEEMRKRHADCQSVSTRDRRHRPGYLPRKSRGCLFGLMQYSLLTEAGGIAEQGTARGDEAVGGRSVMRSSESGMAAFKPCRRCGNW
jgi:hypothetical protein